MKHVKHLLFLSILCSIVLFNSCGDSDDPVVDTPANTTDDTTIDDSDTALDSDSDGIADSDDTCVDTPSGETVDSSGCSDSQKDTDGDGVSDDLDNCEGTTEGTDVGEDGCALISDDSTTDDSDTECIASTATNDIAVIACKYYNDDALTVVVGETTITITSTNEPDHKSMYYAPSNPLYEEYSEPDNEDFYKNPNTIAAMNYTFTIPRFPEAAINSEATPFGPMGVSINSVVFYNQNARPGDDILEELNTFDQYEGHPTNTGSYHYHIEPTWLTETKGDSTFLGLLLDGFPVYGPVEGGVTLTNDDLDDYHGHSHSTTHFPEGIYHYHITAELPWINGGEFYGAPGTVTQ